MLLSADSSTPRHRRQHPIFNHRTSSHPHGLPSPSTQSADSSSLDVDNSFGQSPLISKFESSLALPLYDYPSPPADDDGSYMHRNYSYSAPSQVPPTSSRSASTQSSSQNLPFDDGGVAPASWLQSGNSSHLAPQAGQQRFRFQGQVAGHKRSNSGSTITSAGPASPFTPISSSTYPRIVDQESHHYPSPLSETYDHTQAATVQYSKPLPTQSTNFTASFLSPEFRNFAPSQNADYYAYQHAMTRALMAQESSGMGGAGPMSGDFDDGFKATMNSRNSVPKLDRTMSDIYQDELYNPNVAVSAPAPQISTPASSVRSSGISPRRDVFSERLQAANNSHLSAGSRSPTSSLSRDRSPFQPTSKYLNDEFSHTHTGSPMPRLGSAAQLREAQKAEADARAFDQHNANNSSLQAARTISPKDALIDVGDAEASSMPSLFPEEAALQHSHQGHAFTGVKQEASDASDFILQQNLDSMASARKESPSNHSAPSNSSRRRAAPQIPQQYPFISQPRHTESSNQSNSDSVPDLPAHLISMESTKSEAAHSSSQEESSSSSDVQRPSDTSANGGTYSCTYHGCTQRFETPSKLQKHKRDGHRQLSPSQQNGGAGADSLANRNSQAGPHKCERINPSTNKPCNSIFSRPYDLTRHEDTIHNIRKQKVKCQFCTEEKTFSRNDALTRHMRVVHPEVDFPGKTNKRSRG